MSDSDATSTAADEAGPVDTHDETVTASEVAADYSAAVESGTDEAAAADPPPTGPSRLKRLLLPIALVAVLVVSAGVAAVAFFGLHRGDERVDEATSAAVVQAASDGAVALLSYTPDTLDQDFAAAKSRLTGDFLNYYNQFTQEIVTPAAKQKSVKTSAAVVRSALSKIEPSSAEVLLFINQSTVSKENPDGSFTASSVKVEMTKVGDNWLISSFDPV